MRKFNFIMTSLIIVAASAFTASAAAKTIAEAIQACSATQNSLQRLVCFDRIASNLNDYRDAVMPERAVRQAPQTASPQVSPPQTRVPEGPDEMDSFGQANVVDDTLFASVVSISRDRNDYFTVTLNNGQVWRQTEISRVDVEQGSQVKVEEGIFGAYYLQVEGSGRTARVVRVK